jgi:hypothetical protein
LLAFLDELEYIEAALSADDETKDLAKPFHDELTEWDAVFKKERAGRRGVIRADAVVAVRNAQLDGTTLKFGANVLAETGGDRKSSVFRRFFSVAPSQFVRQPLRKQCETTLNVVITELDKLDPKHTLRAFASPLSSLAKAALKALDARATVRNDASQGGEALRRSEAAAKRHSSKRFARSRGAEGPPDALARGLRALQTLRRGAASSGEAARFSSRHLSSMRFRTLCRTLPRAPALKTPPVAPPVNRSREWPAMTQAR